MRIEARQAVMTSTLQAISEGLAALRQDLAGVARAQQVTDLRRDLAADLRPLIADVVKLEIAAGRAGARQSVRIASGAGVVNSGQTEAVQTGAGLQASVDSKPPPPRHRGRRLP